MVQRSYSEDNFQCILCSFRIKGSDTFCSGCGSVLKKLSLIPKNGIGIYLPPGGTGNGFVEIRNAGYLSCSIDKIRLEGLDGKIEEDDIDGFVLDSLSSKRIGVHLNKQEASEGKIVIISSNEKYIVPIRAFRAPRIEPTDEKGNRLEKIADNFSLPVHAKDNRIKTVIKFRSNREELNLKIRKIDIKGNLNIINPYIADGGTLLKDLKIEIDSDLPEGDRVINLSIECDGLEKNTLTINVDATETPKLKLSNIRDFDDKMPFYVGLGKKERRKVKIKNVGSSRILVEEISKEEQYVKINKYDKHIEVNANSTYDIEININNDKIPTKEKIKDTFTISLKCAVKYGERFEKSDTVIIPIYPFYDKSQRLVEKGREEKNIPVAIDFGTTNTCIGYFGRRLAQIENNPAWYNPPDYGAQLHDLDTTDKLDFEFPSAILFRDFMKIEGFSAYSSEDDSLELGTFGEAAKILRTANIENFMRSAFSFKPRLCTEMRFYIYDKVRETKPREFSAGDLVKIFLQEVFRRFQQEIGGKVSQVIATFPLTFDDKQKDELRKILSEVTGIVDDSNNIEMETSEPLALAMNRITELIGKKELVIDKPYLIGIYDYGGGTTDINIIKFIYKGYGIQYKILSSLGISNGGEYLTFVIAKKIFDGIKKLEGVDFFVGEKQLSKKEAKGVVEGLRFPQRDEIEIMNPRMFTNEDREFYKDLITTAENVKLYYEDYYYIKDENGDIVDEKVSWTVEGQILKRNNKPYARMKYNILKADIEEVIEPIIRSGILTVEKMCEKSIIEKKDNRNYLDELLLCGNASKLPSVKRIAEQIFGDIVRFDKDMTKIGVVKGALEAYNMRKTGIIEKEGEEEDEWGVTKLPLGIINFSSFINLFDSGTSWKESAIENSEDIKIKVTKYNYLIEIRWQKNYDGEVRNPTDYPLAGIIDLGKYLHEELKARFFIKDKRVGCAINYTGKEENCDTVFWDEK